MGEKMNDKIGRIMKDPKHIRNICTSAHIHHGKTAFTDNLLAASGLMAEKLAGDLDKGMATWQHSDEQERLMTVDAANVSMVHDFGGNEYLINLIDTPGHVDFGGNVTRAMRAIDGTIVLICASEGIMPQTETVLKQALRERVKPILFINKVDRLIKEIKLTPQEIQRKFAKILLRVNNLIEKYAPAEHKQDWQVKIEDSRVAFGSALHKWGLNLDHMKLKKVSFQDIIDAYTGEAADVGRKVDELSKKAPLPEPVLDMFCQHLPNPYQ